jgi:hypothetical protein
MHWVLIAFLAAPALGQVSVLTQHNDPTRTGANLQETTLTVSNVNNAHFGKLAYRLVDGNIYAQPLIVAQAKVASRPGPVDIAIVATENNSVYAFDAGDVDQNSTTAQLWQTGLGPSIASADIYAAIGAPWCTDITLQIGITGTPAVQITGNQAPKSGVVYAAAKSKSGNAYTYTLYALNLADGTKMASIPIQGAVSGTGIGSTGSGTNAKMTFSPLLELNRPGLLLVGNTLYVVFGGHCDKGNYHGWVFAYDVTNPKAPKNIGIFCTTPNGNGPLFEGEPVEGMGGIWMSGEGPAADSDGNVYFVTANGTNNGTTDFGDSVVKVTLAGGKFQVQDWFTPQNETVLKDHDVDLGSGGAALIPNSHLLLAGGKEGRMYLIDRNNMGKGASPSLQSFQVTHDAAPPFYYNIHGTPVIWPRANDMFVYIAGEEDPVKQYRLIPDTGPGGAGWKFESGNPPFRTSPISAPYPNFPNGEFGQAGRDAIWMPGGFLALSANGTTDGTGILWVTMPYAGNANHLVVRGILRAFDASDVSKAELWDSENTGNQNDRLGQFAKFCPPTVANGKVYVATFQQEFVTANGTRLKAQGGDQPALVIYGPR